MKRAKCPSCNQSLPFFLFRADRKIKADKNQVLFLCPNCKAKLLATSNEAHQKNFIWVLLTPPLAAVYLFAFHDFIPSNWRPIYYFLGIVLATWYPVSRGQHKMDIEITEKKK